MTLRSETGSRLFIWRTIVSLWPRKVCIPNFALCSTRKFLLPPLVIPATDLSEQISTAGTGNMKFMVRRRGRGRGEGGREKEGLIWGSYTPHCNTYSGLYLLLFPPGKWCPYYWHFGRGQCGDEGGDGKGQHLHLWHDCG